MSAPPGASVWTSVVALSASVGSAPDSDTLWRRLYEAVDRLGGRVVEGAASGAGRRFTVRGAGDLVVDGPLSPELEAALAVLVELAGARLSELDLQAEQLSRSVQLARLNDLSRQLNSAETAEAVLATAAEGARTLCRATATGLYQLREGLLSLVGHQGSIGDLPATIRVVDALGAPLLGGPAVRSFPLGTSTLDGGAALVLALSSRGRTAGVLLLRRGPEDGPWNEGSRSLAEGIAEHLTVALRHIDLLERTRRDAAYDELTGLASRRQFMRELARETERVKRQGSPLSLLMIDADHFKAVNDTHGHGGGDEVLRTIARCLKSGTRSLDVVGRLGGEEIGVLLPSAATEQAMLVAERLRRAIEQSRTEWRGAVIRVTVSVGVAEWDPEWSFEDLLEVADAALYQSKATGRNRVTESRGLETLVTGTRS